MASHDHLKADIADIARRPNAVEFEEVDRILRQLGASEPRKTKHGYLYRVPGCTRKLMINHHADGRKTIPRYCVRDICQCMSELELL